MKRLIAFLFALGVSMSPVYAQPATVTAKVVATCGTQSLVSGTAASVSQNTSGSLCDSGGGGGGGGNASVGTNGAAAPTSSTQIGIRDSSGNLQPASATNPVPVTGSFSATIAGFTPNGVNSTPLAVTTASAQQALPTGTSVNVFNTGSNTAFVQLGTGTPTATASGLPIPPNSGCVLTVSTNTNIAAITSMGTASLNVNGGSGLGNFCYGGGGASSATSSVNVAQVNGVTTLTGAGATGTGSQRATVAQDTTTVAGAAPTTTGIYVTGPSAAALSTSALQTTGNTSLGTIATNSGTQATAANQTAIQGTVAGGTAATKSELTGSVYNSTPITVTNTQQSALQGDANGYLKVNIAAGGGSGGVSVAQASTTSGQNVSPSGCATVSSAPTNTNAQTNMVTCDTSGNLNVNVKSATGVAQGSTTSGQSISPIGGAVTTSAPTYTTGQTNLISLDTAGNTRVNCVTGCSTATVGTLFTLTAAASTNATSVKASAGTLRHISVYNNSATLAWLSFYNTASTPTCGTGIVYQTMIPANSTSGSGSVEDISAGLTFSSGIGICVATGIAGTGSVAATTYVVNLGYN